MSKSDLRKKSDLNFSKIDFSFLEFCAENDGVVRFPLRHQGAEILKANYMVSCIYIYKE
jgi:hypothetical protein